MTQALAQGRIHSEFGRISRLSRVATKMACKHGGLAHGNVKGTYLDIVNFNLYICICDQLGLTWPMAMSNVAWVCPRPDGTCTQLMLL